MPFRAKLKRTFGSKKSGSGESTPSNGSGSSPKRTDIEYYKPHEIPKSKYRGKVDKEHQEKLEAYSFADAFGALRRKSSQALSGTFSPGGTQSQSRRGSWMSRTKSSLSTRSDGSDAESPELRRKSVASAGAPREGPLDEIEDEDTNVSNIGMSRMPKAPGQPPRTTDPSDNTSLKLEKTVTAGRPSSSDNLPFTAQDLEKTRTQATLRPRRGTVIAAPIVQPEGITA